MKLSLAALVASIGFVALGSGFPGASPANAEPRHWFYNDYGYYDGRVYPNRGYGRRYYDDRAYDQEEFYDGEDDVVYEQPRRRQKKKRKWIEKRVRDVIKFATKKAKRKERKRARRLEQRANRQRLYDVRRGDGWRSDEPQTTTRGYAPAKRRAGKPSGRVKLAYVPLPRTKPYHLIPENRSNLPNLPNLASVETGRSDVKNKQIREISLDGKKPAGSFDDRPSLTSSAKKPARPDRPQSKSPSKSGEIKPIRIEVKKPKASSSRVFKPQAQKVEVNKPAIRKTRAAVNQLSCNKVKSIVAEFGFSDVTARTCTGNVYDFNAKRDGKPYSVKVSSLSGELKGVKRVK